MATNKNVFKHNFITILLNLTNKYLNIITKRNADKIKQVTKNTERHTCTLYYCSQLKNCHISTRVLKTYFE